jgi:serine protease Do
MGGREPQQVSPFAPAFKTALESAGYKVITPGEENLFDPEAGAADYEAAAVVTNEHIDACVIEASGLLGTLVEKGAVRGTGSMTVDWQIYSRLRKQVVAHVSTSGTSEISHAVVGGAQQLTVMAFAENVRALAQNADFRAAMSAPRATTAGFQMPGQQAPVALAGSLKAGPRKIADATGSVVAIINSAGSGSGILVSSDGYVLTNAHVVGDDKDVRVRWSDGLETLAHVERVSKNRDVAIIKTSSRDRSPLALKRGPVTPGERVYAIGAPNGVKFQGTVSSGVISADRVFDGLRYIQSDTSISPGSSGGALLDEQGAVIGVTVAYVKNGGLPAGLNLFIPIGDAIDFLALEQH